MSFRTLDELWPGEQNPGAFQLAPAVVFLLDKEEREKQRMDGGADPRVQAWVQVHKKEEVEKQEDEEKDDRGKNEGLFHSLSKKFDGGKPVKTREKKPPEMLKQQLNDGQAMLAGSLVKKNKLNDGPGNENDEISWSEPTVQYAGQ